MSATIVTEETLQSQSRPPLRPKGTSRVLGAKVGLHASPLGLLLFGYILWRPVSHGEMLYPALAIIALLSLFDILTNMHVRYPRYIVMGSLIFVFLIFAAGLLGSIQGNAGTSQQLATIGGGAIIWLLWAFAMTPKSVRRLMWVIVVVSGISSLAMLAFIGQSTGVLPAIMPESILVSQNAGIDLTEGTAIRFSGMSTLAITAPLLSAALISPNRDIMPPRWVVFSCAALSILAALFGGRRGIAVVTLMAPLLLILARFILGHRSPIGLSKKPRLLLLGGAAALAWAITSGPLTQVYRAAEGAFATYFSGGASGSADDLRRGQARELLSGFGEHPLIGSGLGAVLPSGYTRSAERPWAFEMQYHQMLFNIGLLGICTLVLVAILWCVCICREISPDSELSTPAAVAMVGCLGLLAANASNPYMQAVGHQWGLFLVLGVAIAAAKQRHEASGFPTRSRGL